MNGSAGGGGHAARTDEPLEASIVQWIINEVLKKKTVGLIVKLVAVQSFLFIYMKSHNQSKKDECV